MLYIHFLSMEMVSLPVMDRMTVTMMIMLVWTSLSVSWRTSEQGTSTSPTLSLRHLEILSHHSNDFRNIKLNLCYVPVGVHHVYNIFKIIFLYGE